MTRDMTKAQFNAALARNGFRRAFAGWFEDTTAAPGCDGVSFGGIYCRRPFRLHRRETLAKLIANRERYAKRAAS